MTPLSTLTRLVNKNFLRLQNSVKLRHSLLLQRGPSALLVKIKDIVNFNVQYTIIISDPKLDFLGPNHACLLQRIAACYFLLVI